MEQEIEFLKKRLVNSQKENENLKKENKVINQELSNLKKLITDIIDLKQSNLSESSILKLNTEQDMRLVLEFQSQRIKNLEQELNNVTVKYERQLFNTSDPELGIRPYSAQYQTNFPEYQKIKQESKLYQEEIGKMAQNYGREIAQLKQKVAKQDAEILLSQSQMMGNNNFGSYSSHKMILPPKNKQPLNAITSQYQPQSSLSLNNSLQQINEMNNNHTNKLNQSVQKLSDIPQDSNTNRRSIGSSHSKSSSNSAFENKFGHLYNKASIIQQNQQLSYSQKQNQSSLLESLQKNQNNEKNNVSSSYSNDNNNSNTKNSDRGSYDQYLSSISKNNNY